jgi:hypothetical protein
MRSLAPDRDTIRGMDHPLSSDRSLWTITYVWVSPFWSATLCSYDNHGVSESDGGAQSPSSFSCAS